MKKVYMKKDVWRDYLTDQVKKEGDFAYAAFCQNNAEAEAIATGRMQAFKEVWSFPPCSLVSLTWTINLKFFNNR